MGAADKLALSQPQAFEGLLLKAAGMAVAKSMQPATAENPIGMKWLWGSFPSSSPFACRGCNGTDRKACLPDTVSISDRRDRLLQGSKEKHRCEVVEA